MIAFLFCSLINDWTVHVGVQCRSMIGILQQKFLTWHYFTRDTPSACFLIYDIGIITTSPYPKHTHITLNSRWEQFHQANPAYGKSRGAPCDAGAVTKIQYGGICQEMIFFAEKNPRLYHGRGIGALRTHVGTTGLLLSRGRKFAACLLPLAINAKPSRLALMLIFRQGCDAQTGFIKTMSGWSFHSAPLRFRLPVPFSAPLLSLMHVHMW